MNHESAKRDHENNNSDFDDDDSIVLAETEQGRGILGVIDGSSPKGVEGDEDIAWRKAFLREIGYKV